MLGYLAGALLIASSALHALMGWPAIDVQLASNHVPADLVFGLQMGWQFGGMAMLVLGVSVLLLFRDARRGRPLQRPVVLAIGAGYLLFGAVEFLLSQYAPFTFMFIAPGVLLLAAAWPGRGAPT